MRNVGTIRVHDQAAAEYDMQVHEFNSYSHDVLFGMTFEYVNSQDCLLDLGIGTGLSSSSFAQLGVTVYGCDGSSEMLKICECKGFAKELKVFDLRDTPLPYSDNFFDHVICCGVLHFFNDLETIFREIRRIVKPGGIFAFTVASQPPTVDAANSNNPEEYVEAFTPFGVSIYKHSSQYISKTLQTNSMETLKTQRLVMRGYSEDNNEHILFNALVTCVDVARSNV